MRDDYVLRLEAKPDADQIVPIYQGLVEYNFAKTGDTPNYVVVSIRDPQGEIAGGLVGITYLQWLFVQTLWVPEQLRSHGYGTALMRAAEEEALRRGCPHAFVETFSFQALPFYLKLGYQVHSRLDGLPPGGARYALTKELAGVNSQ